MEKKSSHFFRLAQHAFSLVELSIVLVILGLLVGGILSGKSLIKAAELRKVARDLERFSTAIATFRGKYFVIPGDMPNATQFWGVAGGSGSDSTCANTVSTDTKTCNGDGDGTIGGAVSVDYQIIEYYRSWQHLANAGLIEGSYTGAPNPPVTGVGGFEDAIGINIPKAPYGNAGYNMRAINVYVFTPRPKDLWIGMADCCHSTQRYIELSVLLPEVMWNIDSKLDDGKPGLGSVQTIQGYWGGCATTSVAATSEYDLSNSSGSCQFAFNAGF